MTVDVLGALSRCITDATDGGGSYLVTIALVSGEPEPMVAVRRVTAGEAIEAFKRESLATAGIREAEEGGDW